MSSLFNPDKKFTQSDIATLLGISDRQVRNLTQQGILPSAKGRNGINPLDCIHRYITYKSQQKSSPAEAEVPGNDEEHYAKVERDLKIEDKRETIAMKKAKRVLFEKTYGPLLIITETLQQVSSRVTTRLDGLLPKVKSVWPDMPPEAVEVFEAEIAAASNECADVRPNLEEYMECDPLGGPEWIVGDEEKSTR
ncbi:hypothetical protein [Photobacterium leiognathi]|uniref:hypothetical protein n=1 Tax=Photobacterium leiognathi TaxID=553611 RepID=UPI00020880C3|nr:hypothetical protein [Photobacterium leiognathi]PSW48346.1 hypothetical protein CTM83_20140 [Photobacterium leiognathi subsp. mandapamensis]GAA03219.1 hypothetical protein PMSV_4144 [Photobacterium leiognathi subsp. mandapamensis svers.1.1.]